MTASFVLVGVGEMSEFKVTMSNIKQAISHIGGKVTYSIRLVPSNIQNITKCIISTIEKNSNDVIIIFTDLKMKIVFEVFKEILTNITEQDISKKLKISLADIKKKLDTTVNQSMCGIRNKSLIISISGSCEKIVKSLKEHGYAILRAVHLISKSDKINRDKTSCEGKPKEAKFPVQIDIKDSALTIHNLKKFQSSEVSLQDAIELIKNQIYDCKQVCRMELETLDISDAYGKILCDNIHSKCNVPPFRSAVKHGYAVLVSDGIGIRRIVRTKASTEFTLESGTCLWVKSGDPIPDGATAVVQIANTKNVKIEYDNDDIEMQEEIIEILIAPNEGENIRPIGYEIPKGSAIVSKNTRIGVAEIGLLALCGYDRITVIAQPSIGILSIGDDLEEPGNVLRPGHMYDSNRAILISLLKENDFECTDFGIVPYHAYLIIQKITEIIEKVDVLVTTGSASDRDMLKSILLKYFEVILLFGRVNIKPGKSTAFGTSVFNGKLKYYLCLSGNPASVPIAARLLLLPLLNQLRDYYGMPDIKILARIRSQYDLHLRPKCIWTVLKWNEDDKYASVFDTADINRNLFRYQNANALLLLPSRSSEVQNISMAFITTLYIGSK